MIWIEERTKREHQHEAALPYRTSPNLTLDLRNIGLIPASDNAVATDAVMATMMGCERDG